ncbi:leucine--tRNA ligase [Marinoscillum sp. MHG1-6]|uniref:leucine--tRNA ligase n=1 Tax=Marinoscillum sp. MHG1-6 TaxID=2959627 RepID=UPI002157813B|nr:leucine--tRNA ligase [Marinoscillum sp. MHG1-6]
MAEYNPSAIEPKWQVSWTKNQTYKVQIDNSKPKYYVLDMFPYPSGAGLHVGHPLGYIATDIISRYKRLKGFNVLHPMGFDAFGLPAEQYAIQTGQHPAKTTDENIARYKEQLTQLGFCYDWSREFRTSEPSYYKWTQWIFKQIFNSWYNKDADKAEPIDTLIAKFEASGNEQVNAACDEETPTFTVAQWKAYSDDEKQQMLLKYRLTYIANTTVNWCPALGTVLSNDEVKDGFSERGGHPVIKKTMPQWNMRITAYADRLLEGLDKIDWPDPIKEMQRNWIGKSYGAEVDFQVENSESLIKVFTTRIDTIYGVTCMVIAPEHELVPELTTADKKEEVDSYVEAAKNRSERDRMSDVKTVSGVFTGSYVVNPFNEDKVPIYIADYVLAGYGTGAVMAVPSGDQRDFDFATHFGLEKPVILDAQKVTETEADPTKEGRFINSGILNGLTFDEATQRAIEFVEEKGIGKAKVNYKIRDAVYGRQRYWGEPFPVYYKNGVPHLLEEDELPLELPSIDKFLPTEDGEPPLGRAENWKTKDGEAYELTTMPGWAGSSWYFFRYMDPQNDKEFCGKEALEYWQDVDFYMGGSEHATGHLLYSRFWTKFLYDMGYIKVDEYAKKLVNQGMIQGRSNLAFRVKNENKYVSFGLRKDFDCYPVHVDVNIVKEDVLDIEAFKKFRPDAADATFELEGDKFICGWEVEKMSKSKYNVVNPDDLVEKYGADTLRMYEMFLGPVEQSKPWNTNGIEGVFKFLRKFWGLFHDNGGNFSITNDAPSAEELKVLHGTIKKIEEDVERLSLNTSVSNFMIATNELASLKCKKKEVLEPFVILLAPYAPHISEELWSLLGHEGTVFDAAFPKFDEKYLKEESKEYPIMINGKMRAKISFSVDAPKDEMEKTVLDNDVVQKWLEGKPPKKVIIVPNKIVNIVA